MTNNYFIPEPPSYMFSQTESFEQNIMREERGHYIIDRIEQGNKGIEVWYKDCPFPRKGFPYTRAVVAVNILKKLVTEFLKVAVTPSVFLGLLIGFLSPWRIKNLEKALRSFNTITYRIMAEHVIKPEYMTPFTGELQGFIFAFLARLGVDKEIAKNAAIMLATTVQYDNAYRYRMEDIASEVREDELMKNPRKEILRLAKLYLQRETAPYIKDYARYLAKLVSIPFLFPKVKKAFREAIKGAELERFKLDEDDYFWCIERHDYGYRGKTPAERVKEWKEKGYKMPQTYALVK